MDYVKAKIGYSDIIKYMYDASLGQICTSVIIDINDTVYVMH